MNILKGKSAGAYVLMVSEVLCLVATVAYLIFGLSSGTFVGSVFALLLIAALGGAALCFYRGFFADYIPPVMTALVTAGLVLLARDSINDLTAFMVGMGDYFGNADNAGPRIMIAAVMLLTILVTIIGSFMKREKKNS